MNDYLLAYDVGGLDDLHPQLHSFVKQHKLISQWSQPYNGLYLIKSDATLVELVTTFDEFFARRVFHFICPIVPEWCGGILPRHIWEWLRAPPATGLGGILSLLNQYQETNKATE